MFEVPVAFKVAFIIVVAGITLWMFKDDIKKLIKKANENIEDDTENP